MNQSLLDKYFPHLFNRKSSQDWVNPFMQDALIEANKAYYLEEVPVGCIIIDRNNKEILSRTHNLIQKSKNPNFHAEILAINDACQKLNTKNLTNCDIFVTLEPCTMCASAISNARIGRLYYGAADSKGGAIENGIRFFNSKSCYFRPEIYSGIHAEESEAIMQSFFRKIRKNDL